MHISRFVLILLFSLLGAIDISIATETNPFIISECDGSLTSRSFDKSYINYVYKKGPKLTSESKGDDNPIADFQNISTNITPIYFDIEKLMEDFKITKLEAIEVQARFNLNQSNTTILSTLVEDVRHTGVKTMGNLRMASGLSKITIGLDLKSVIAFTNKHHFYKHSNYDQHLGYNINSQPRFVTVNPYWYDLIRTLRQMDAAIFIYSSLPRKVADYLVDNIKSGDTPLRDTVDGVLSDIHHTFTPNASNRKNSSQKIKDLSFFEDGQNTLFISDNARNVKQTSQVIILNHLGRLKTSPEEYRPKNPDLYISAFEFAVEVIDEVIDQAEERGIPIATAFLPYSSSVDLIVPVLMGTHDVWEIELDANHRPKTREQAFQIIQDNPSIAKMVLESKVRRSP